MRHIFVPVKVVRFLQVCTMLLKKGAAKDLLPAAIAKLMCRDLIQRSPLEKAHSMVLALCSKTKDQSDESLYYTHMSEALDELVDSCA